MRIASDRPLNTGSALSRLGFLSGSASALALAGCGGSSGTGLSPSAGLLSGSSQNALQLVTVDAATSSLFSAAGIIAAKVGNTMQVSAEIAKASPAVQQIIAQHVSTGVVSPYLAPDRRERLNMPCIGCGGSGEWEIIETFSQIGGAARVGATMVSAGVFASSFIQLGATATASAAGIFLTGALAVLTFPEIIALCAAIGISLALLSSLVSCSGT